MRDGRAGAGLDLTWIMESHRVLETVVTAGETSSTDISLGAEGAEPRSSGSTGVSDESSEMSRSARGEPDWIVEALTKSTGMFSVLSFLAAAKRRAFNEADKGPVCIRAWDDERVVRAGPEVRVVGRGSGAGATVALETGACVTSSVVIRVSV